MAQIRVNLSTRVANSKIRYEKRDGRDVIIVPSATLPDNVIMNRILYPASVIEDGYATLDRTPAPLGHPMLNGQYISAREPEAINTSYVGAWNENVRREGGRVFLDKVIDVEAANETKRGKRLLDAIYQQEPISTSTGLLLTMTEATHDKYDFVADSMVADHDAFLLGEAPAASVEQGVGVFVNSQGETESVDVQNISLDDDTIRMIAEDFVWRMEREEEEAERKPLVEKVMQKIRSLLGTIDLSEDNEENEGIPALLTNQEGDVMEIKELAEKLEALAANMLTSEKVAEMLQPLTDQVSGLKANADARDEADKIALVDKVVKANLLDEEDAKELSVNALQKLAAKIKPAEAGESANGHFSANSGEDDADSFMPGGDA